GINAQGAGVSGNYALATSLDASGTTYTYSLVANAFAPFTGKFDGLGHTVSNLVISSSTNDYVGLFGGVAPTGVVSNIGVVGGSVSGHFYVGGLSGFNNGLIQTSFATETVQGTSYVGGITGNDNGTLQSTYSSSVVAATDHVGGLTGRDNGAVVRSYAT